MLTDADMKALTIALDRVVKTLPKRKDGVLREKAWHVAVDGLPRLSGGFVTAKAVPEWDQGGNGIGLLASASADDTIEGVAAEMGRQWREALKRQPVDEHPRE